MSLLDQINIKKVSLKSTNTTVTYPDGRQFLESKDDLIKLNNTTGYVVDLKPDCTPAKVTDSLYLGSQDCCDQSILQQYNITFVLSLGIRPIKHDGVTYKFIDCLDLPETNILIILNECRTFIDSAISIGANILVHCNAGVSRSVSIVTGYLMVSRDLNYDTAFGIVKSVRPCAKPNSGFKTQLCSLK